ncbi:MAG TPA: hypothetical protein VIF15_06605 [Polyangiaceae bacterium]|jgi:hypothetical protein
MRSAWAPLAVVCAVALLRALTASAPQAAPAADEALRREGFRAVASEETSMRREAAKTFPTDPWSRDDDFHQREMKKARDWAHTNHTRFADALSAIDEGLRASWPHGNPAPLLATTPPCRPRAIY